MDASNPGASLRPVIAAVIIMMMVQIMMSMSTMSAPLLVELAASDLGIQIHEVGYYYSIIYGVATLSALTCGSLLSRFGAVRMVQACLALAAFSLCLAATGEPWAVAIAGPLVGFAMGPTTPASSHVLGRLSPPAHRNLIFSMKQTGVPIGNAVAGASLPAMGLAMGWQPPLLVLAGFCVALALAAETHRRVIDIDAGRGGRLFSWREVVAPMAIVMRHGALRRAAFTSGFYSGMQSCVSAFLVATLTQRAGYDLLTAGLVMTVAQSAGAVARILWGFAADRTGQPALTLAVIGAIMAVVGGGVGLVEREWPIALVLIAGAILGGTAVGWNGVYLAEVARLAPADKVGAVTGATSMYTYGGVLAVPTIFALIVAQTDSYAAGFFFAALLASAGAILSLPWLWRDRVSH